MKDVNVKLPINWKICQDCDKMYYAYYYGKKMNDKPYKTIQNTIKFINNCIDCSVKIEQAEKGEIHRKRIACNQNREKAKTNYVKTNHKYIELTNLINKFRANGDIVKLSNTFNALAKLDIYLKEEYDRLQPSEESLDEFLSKTTDEKSYKCKLYLHSLIVLSDLIETLSLSIKDITKEIDPNSNFDFFKDVFDLSKVAGQKVLFMSKNLDMNYQYKFADFADEILDIFLEKMIYFTSNVNNKND